MDLEIPVEKIDLSDHHLGLDIPALEQSIRDLSKEFIQGVLQNNMSLEIQLDDEKNEMYVVLWANLFKGGDVVLAYIPVQELFDEYLKKEKPNE